VSCQISHGHPTKFKVALPMYLAHNRLSSLYISEMLAPVSDTLMHWQLRSSGSSSYTVPRTRTKFGDRAFSAAEPVIWNSIPESTRAVDNVHTFTRLLKTHVLKSTQLILCHFIQLLFQQFLYCLAGPACVRWALITLLLDWIIKWW